MSATNILGTAFAALLNSLWQGAAMALLIWAALRFLPRLNVKINAATSCAVWWAVLAAVVLLPLAPPPAKVPPAPTPVSIEAASVQTAVLPEPAVSVRIATPAASSRVGPLEITAGAGLLAIFAIWSALSILRIAQLV